MSAGLGIAYVFQAHLNPARANSMATKVTSAMSTGSGTTVRFNDQSSNVLCPPPRVKSAKNRVHSPFAELLGPSKLDSVPTAE